jgi:tRNA 2-thiouridine synthesizing protein E
MNHAAENYIRTGHEAKPIPNFPHAPSDWTLEIAEELTQAEGLTLTEEHWRVVRALQELFTRQEGSSLNARQLHDALDEDFHAQGGIKFLYRMFPKGPLAQGCLIAGVQPPGGTQDQGFGSAVYRVR